MKKKGYELGGRNVFEDLGVPNADEHVIKAQLVLKIETIMKRRRLTQQETADLLGVRQPDISKMLRGEFRQFSVERLLRFLVKLDHDVEIAVRLHRAKSNVAAMHAPYGRECTRTGGPRVGLGVFNELARKANKREQRGDR